MEPQFEVRYVANHKMMAEFMRKYSVGPRPWMLIVGGAVFLWAAFWLCIGGLSGRDIYYIVMLGFIQLFIGLMPHYVAWMTLKNTKKQNGGTMPETVVTFGENIEIHEGMVHLTIEYRKILRVLRLKHSYMLMMGKRNGVMLDPNGFTKGTFEEFKQFLRETYPNLQIPE